MLKLNKNFYSLTIERYLEDIISQAERFHLDKTHDPEWQQECVILPHLDRYKSGDASDDIIFEYLEQEGAIKDFRNSDTCVFVEYKDIEKNVVYPEKIYFKVTNLQKVKDVYKKILEYKPANKTGDISKLNFLTLDENGDFFFGEKRKAIKFPNHDDFYYRLFYAVYDLAKKDKENIAHYEHIKQYFGKEYRQEITVSQIRNSVNNSLLDGRLPKNRSKKLIEIVRGKGVRLND